HQILTNFNAINEQTAYTYNSTQQLTSITMPTGLILTNIYGADGYLAQQAALGIATNSFTWASGRIQTRTDPRGLTVTETWDNLQRLRRADLDAATGPRERIGGNSESSLLSKVAVRTVDV